MHINANSNKLEFINLIASSLVTKGTNYDVLSSMKVRDIKDKVNFSRTSSNNKAMSLKVYEKDRSKV